ncbi:hypothetical protein ACHAPT_009299 [Fusarium lateritium]
MESSAWNKRNPEYMYHMFRIIWSSQSLDDIQTATGDELWKFAKYETISNRLGFQLLTSGTIPSQWYCELPGLDSEPRLHFSHLQATFDSTLLRNWFEIIARIVELAMAGPEEYKKCLETIFKIQHEADQCSEADQGGEAWERLMRHVLKLEHRIPDWKDQLSRYERGEILADLEAFRRSLRTERSHLQGR